MNRAALYLRVSTTDQNLANQLPALRQIALARGLDIVCEIEEHISGAKKVRKGLKQLLAGAHRGDYNVVIVWAIDRLGRTMSGVLETITELDRLSCKVVSYQEPWLTMDGPVRSLLVAIFGWVAEQERARLIERTQAGLVTARKNGKTLGRPCVTLDIDEAYRLRKQGLSIAAAAKKLGVGKGTLHRALMTEKTGT